MPRMYVEWLNIRTDKQRRDLSKRLTQAMCDVAGVPKDMVTVIFNEIDPRLQCVGGVFWSEKLKKAKAAKRKPARRRARRKV